MYKKILVATDLLEQNNALIAKAALFAKEHNAEMYLVTVVEPLPSYGYSYVGFADLESKLIEEAKEGMKAISARIGVTAANQIVEVGQTKAEIVRVASERKVDLIMIGSHGHHGLSHLIGSTANAVLHHAECDVLVVRLR